MASNAIEFGEKTHYTVQGHSRPSKVIEDGINRKPVYATSYNYLTYLGVIATYCSNFGHFAFFEPPCGGGGLGTMYDVHLKHIAKRVVDWVFIELLRLSIMPCLSPS